MCPQHVQIIFLYNIRRKNIKFTFCVGKILNFFIKSIENLEIYFLIYFDFDVKQDQDMLLTDRFDTTHFT